MSESNVSDFFFECPAADTSSLRVVSFTGEETLSRPFRFVMQLRSEKADYDYAALLDQQATLTVHAPGGTGRDSRLFHGILSRVTMLEQDGTELKLEAELVPRLWRLSLRRNHRIFQDKSVPEVVEAVLKADGLSGTDYTFSMQASYPQREYVVQYDESDLDFISRLLESQGITYCFEQQDKMEVLLITDHGQVAAKSTQPVSSLSVRSTSGLVPQDEETVQKLRDARSVIISKSTLRDFNYTTPANQLESVSSGNGPADYEDYHYPGEYLVADHGDLLAERRQQEYEVHRQTLRGTSDCRSFSPGFQFTLKDHPRAALNTDYTLVSVRHAGADSSIAVGSSLTRYENEFECVPATVPYRPPVLTRRPVIQGVQTAMCTGPAGGKRHMDDLGRAKVKFHWDRSSKKHDDSSIYIRVGQPSGGLNHGIHFHPLVGDEVLVHFEEGNPDRPVIIGCVYNADSLPPLKPDGEVQNAITTPYGTELLLCDKTKQVILNSGGGQKMTFTDDGKTIKHETSGGHSLIMTTGS